MNPSTRGRFESGLGSKTSWAVVALCLALVPIAAAGEPEPVVLEGFSPESSAWQQQCEALLEDLLSPQKMEEHLEHLADRPHLAGSEGTRRVVDYLHRQLSSFGFETETVRYDGYLPAPVSVSVELVEPVVESLPTTEDRVADDPFTEDVAAHPGWNGYSPSGEAVGHVVYAHFGSERDLEKLLDLGVDLRGKILLMRYFGTGAGRKIRNAERFGAAAVVLYSDPAEDGYPYGEVYPWGNWRPAGAIMRRSIIFLPYEGDPLSPGWASRPGAKRLRPEDVALPGIPVLSISYRSAQRLLDLLAGPVAPPEWQGRLPVTYRIGPGPAKLRVRTEMDNRDRPILNVIGRLEGQAEPDQWVIVSNHHDAWIFGAGDPSSGTAALLELARGLGELAKRECRPRRTVIVAFWDAEEMLLGGSTEWVEDLEEELLEKAVAAINMDSAVFNPDRPLSVAAHPVLHRLFREVTRNVRDPRTGRSTFDVWRDLQNRYREVPGVDGWGEFFDPGRELTEPWVFEAPYDDAAPFYNYLALPSSDMYYGADYGMYHSIYENIHWMKTVVDPTFEYHSVMAQIQGLVAMRLANAELLPLDFAEEARYWRRAYRDLEAVASNRGQKVPGIQEALGLIGRWESEAEAWRHDAQRFLAGAESPPDLAEVNLEINRRARDFLRPTGRPEAPNERNLFYGSSYDFAGVSGSTLPGIRFNLDRGRVEEAEREAALYLEAIRRRVQGVVKLRQEMREVR